MLKALILRKKIDSAKAALEALRAKDAEFEKREAEITRSVEEAADMEEGEEKAEAQKIVEEEAEKFDADKSEHEASKATLERDIEEMEKELEGVEADQNTAAERAADVPQERTEKGEKTIMKRNKFFRSVENVAEMSRGKT